MRTRWGAEDRRYLFFYCGRKKTAGKGDDGEGGDQGVKVGVNEGVVSGGGDDGSWSSRLRGGVYNAYVDKQEKFVSWLVGRSLQCMNGSVSR